MALSRVTPILRSFDEAKAREFYIEFLGFQVDFEHRFEANFPLYMGISKDDCVLHITEHHGDCSPGSAIRIATTGLAAYHQTLADKEYKYARPGLKKQPWGTLEMTITDPFGNRLTFAEEIKQ
ncbi:MAG: VOC family protein [Caldilineaceae bacterium]|nr:VOC family protein [Caldilineaceae bacterium]